MKKLWFVVPIAAFRAGWSFGPEPAARTGPFACQILGYPNPIGAF